MVGWGNDSDNSEIEDMIASLLDGVENSLVHSFYYQGGKDNSFHITEQWRFQYQKVGEKCISILDTISVSVIFGRVMVIQGSYTLHGFVKKEESERQIILIQEQETE